MLSKTKLIFILMYLLLPYSVNAEGLQLHFSDQENGLIIRDLKIDETIRGTVIEGVLRSSGNSSGAEGVIELQFLDSDNKIIGVEQIAYNPEKLRKRFDAIDKSHRTKVPHVHFQSSPLSRSNIEKVVLTVK